MGQFCVRCAARKFLLICLSTHNVVSFRRLCKRRWRRQFPGSATRASLDASASYLSPAPDLLHPTRRRRQALAQLNAEAAATSSSDRGSLMLRTHAYCCGEGGPRSARMSLPLHRGTYAGELGYLTHPWLYYAIALWPTDLHQNRKQITRCL
nr:hypothetical protein CFP56_11828 [Quercus suber]